ncbi:MAG: DNA polymerase III subunit delta [Rhodobacteraceae bacterium]|nr:DNA polymerase III subunit delta [Paracoccaceae bacterium]
MKLSARDAAGYFARPDPTRTGILIFGADAMRVALKRQELIAALIGPQGEEEMRLSRMTGADLRKEPARVLDALKATGFFPGPRVTFVEEATDAAAPAITAALEDWQDGDAQLVVTAGQLNARSKLRKAFEDHRNAYAVGIYDDPPTRAEIEATLRKAGVQNINNDAMDALNALARAVDPGDFAQTVEKVALYAGTDPVTTEAIDACAPASTEAEMDDLLAIVAEGRAPELGPMLRRLEAQGVTPVTLCIQATRHFRALHTAAADPGGPGQGIARLRPPVFGPRRDRMLRQAQNWGMHRLEGALSELIETDLKLRSAAQTAPAMALMERTLIRVAMRGRQ